MLGSDYLSLQLHTLFTPPQEQSTFKKFTGRVDYSATDSPGRWNAALQGSTSQVMKCILRLDENRRRNGSRYFGILETQRRCAREKVLPVLLGSVRLRFVSVPIQGGMVTIKILLIKSRFRRKVNCQ